MTSTLILLFDGTCNLCEKSVLFVLRRDSGKQIMCIPAQSPAGQALQDSLGIDVATSQSLILVKGDRCLYKSDAVLEILKHLDGYWKLFTVCRFLPRFIRDWSYDFIAKHRYRWFGKKEVCMVPPEKFRDRFPDPGEFPDVDR